jgi:hypothetical protein
MSMGPMFGFIQLYCLKVGGVGVSGDEMLGPAPSEKKMLGK